ncbi:hypothetical protein GR212_35200 [Rhizobium lusitanum]|uniref:Acyl-CoA dehydrogenase C-terminal domain-containing protein n=1 Tax=Rhizobium lusitanum TaxID=293958 RepID=A0A6L9UHJ8_9HYPH|nr:hypothetical protein [Rhizobium lusitanum]
MAAESCFSIALAVKSNEYLIAGIQSVLYVAETCLKAVGTCFELGGTVQVYDQSPRQRRLSDMCVATQHGVVQRHHYAQNVGSLIDKEPLVRLL